MPSYPEADEAQHDHYNDGFNSYATRSTITNHRQRITPIPRSLDVATPLDDPYQQQQPQVVSPLQETPSAIQPTPSSSRLVDAYIGEEYQMPMSGSHLQSQSGLISRNGQASNSGVGIPRRIPRRYKTLKGVELFHHNFVLDFAVPSRLLDMCLLRNEREFTYMRYSAVTCDPNHFKDAGFTLRQVHYDPPRRTELFICMTMYNEDEVLFCRSMHAVIRNIAHLCKRDRSKTWGKEAWKKVVVCIISDGRQRINSRTLSVITTMGAYQEGIAKDAVNDKSVTAHIYEYTTQISVTPSMEIEGAEKGTVPVQLIFCLKERTQKKINSHRWFFNAFGPILQPNICVLLDAGTMPGPTSIYHLWKTFDLGPSTGGACGEIVASKGKYGENLLNPLIAAQNFEYKMSNILDKPLESVFGYLTVLPSAFSAYRYISLQNDGKGEGPLQRYFLGEKMHGVSTDIFSASMYLAEDRVLCWELVSKRGGSWTLHYVKSAYAVTDVPDSVPGLISQRRRWVNGLFFGTVYSIVQFYHMYRTSHSLLRKFWIHVEMVYRLYNLIFYWFALGNYYVAFVILTNALEDYLPIVHYLNLVLNYFYLGVLVMCFLLSLCAQSNPPQGDKRAYTLAFFGFGLIMMYMTVSIFLLSWKGIENVAYMQGRPVQLQDIIVNSIFRNIDLAVVVILGLYVISSLLSFDPWHMITSLPQYLLMVPSYIGVLNVYAFANIHDVLWDAEGDHNVESTSVGVVPIGTGESKNQAEDDALKEKDNATYEDAFRVLITSPPTRKEKVVPTTRLEDYFKTLRKNTLLAWTLSNALLAVIVISAIPKPGSGVVSVFANVYMSVILFSIAGLTAVRFLGTVIYLIVRLLIRE